MKDIFQVLKKKKLQSFFLFYILLLLPILTPLAENYSWMDKLLLVVVCLLLFMAISVICVFVSPRTEKIIYSVMLVFAIIPGSIFLSYLLFAHVMLEQNSVMSLFETNPEESKEFLANYMNVWVIVGTLAYAAVPIVMICRMKRYTPLKARFYKGHIIVSVLIIVAIVSLARVARSVYFINIYRTFITYKVRVHHEKKTIRARQSEPFDIRTIYADTIPQTIVVVIGESLTKDHMSLYGYQRKTNPLLEQYTDSFLLVYREVISPQVHTIPVMRAALSMAEPDYPEYFEERPSLIELYNRLGFETYMITNQAFSEKCHSSYDILLTLAKHKYNFAPKKQYDEIVFTAFDEIMESDKGKDKFILIHLIGSHMAYEYRYPYTFDTFDYEEDGLIEEKPFRKTKEKRMIDNYDNSVLYNDYIVDRMIRQLQEESPNAMLLYFSDHGEELYDYRKFAGHVYEKVSPPMCEVPFLLWMSSYFRDKRSGLVFDAYRPYSTGDFIYSMSDISGMRYEGFDSKRSIFSPDFEPKERFVDEKAYDDILERFDSNKR
ncbi:sulfatase-like hydrolase/transferase [Dysgonomonas sp. 25]|uniref:sulfatase-like hydrolase/transferase n=1 Tax=Dysgonomonas sp. 25 TaxID=2302933 RepID=UPI0013D44042|nr:sulfatase-like hydrolase/transferase [Dysgonomonas sp. 25]NDV68368.1 hypothetical protein [Dysgonomonas sp. 25]